MTTIPELRTAACDACNGIISCAIRMLILYPVHNSELHRRMGFNEPTKTRKNQILWSLLKNNPFVEDKTLDISDDARILYEDDEIIEAYNSGQLTIDEAGTMIVEENSVFVNKLFDVVRTFIHHYPRQAYNSRMSQQLNCEYADRFGDQKCWVIHHVIQTFISTGEIVQISPETSGRKIYAIVGTITPFVPLPFMLRGKYRSFGEAEVARELESYYDKGIRFQSEITFTDCINPPTGASLRFDFKVYYATNPRRFKLIEFDGQQHHRFIKHFHETYEGFLQQQNRDKIKTDYCARKRIRLLRIDYIPQIQGKIATLIRNMKK